MMILELDLVETLPCGIYCLLQASSYITTTGKKVYDIFKIASEEEVKEGGGGGEGRSEVGVKLSFADAHVMD